MKILNLTGSPLKNLSPGDEDYPLRGESIVADILYVDYNTDANGYANIARNVADIARSPGCEAVALPPANGHLPDVLLTAAIAQRLHVIDTSPPRTQYLLTITGTMDDTPVRLFDAWDAAVAWLIDNPDPPHLLAPTTPEIGEAREVAGGNWPSEPCLFGYSLWRIVDGRPTGLMRLWDEVPFVPTEPKFT